MKIKILLVEDDVNLGLVISDQLNSDGYSVSLCCDGVEALQSFNKEVFHLWDLQWLHQEFYFK